MKFISLPPSSLTPGLSINLAIKFSNLTLWLLLTFTRNYFAEQKFERMLIFQGVTYFFSGGVVKKYVEIMFTYPEIVLVAEINMYMYKKWLVLHHLILSKDCVAHFPNQLF